MQLLSGACLCLENKYSPWREVRRRYQWRVESIVNIRWCIDALNNRRKSHSRPAVRKTEREKAHNLNIAFLLSKWLSVDYVINTLAENDTNFILIYFKLITSNEKKTETQINWFIWNIGDYTNAIFGLDAIDKFVKTDFIITHNYTQSRLSISGEITTEFPNHFPEHPPVPHMREILICESLVRRI